MHSTGISNGTELEILTDVSGQAIGPIFEGQEIQKRKQKQLKFTDTVFLGTLSNVWLFTDSQHFRNQLCFRFQAEKHQLQPLGSDFLIRCTPQKE